MRRFYLALGGVAMLLVTACGSSGHRAASVPPAAAASPTTSASVPVTTADPPTTADPTTTIPATTTTVPDTAVVPKTITVAYVDAVLAQLNHIYGNAVRASVAAHKLTFVVIKDLSSVYTPQLGGEEQVLFVEGLTGNMENVRPVPGDPITSVRKLIHASDTCIYAEVTTNSDPEVIQPEPSAADEYMGLQRIPSGTEGLRVNHTPWIWFFDLVNKTPTNVPNQCPGK